MNWLEDKKYITERYFEAINICNVELYGRIKNHLDEVRPIYPLIGFIIERLVTVTDLTTRDRIWDAEIVHRTALETFIKFLFITSAKKEEQQLRLNEYWNDLEEINRLKQSEQAKKNLAQFGHIEIMRLASAPNVVSHEEEIRLRTKWTKVNRQKLEQKWAFSEILNSLIEDYKGQPMEMFIGLAHSYRMASHVGHGDETGILIIVEREQRSEEQKDIANFAHYLRLMSDSFSYCMWTATETMHFINDDPNFFLELNTSLNDIRKLSHQYSLKLYDDPDYDKYRNKPDIKEEQQHN
jgi:hypothetical protein